MKDKSIEELSAEFDQMFLDYSTDSTALQEKVADLSPSQKLIELTRMQLRMEKIQNVEAALKAKVRKQVLTQDHVERTKQPKESKGEV